VETPVAGASRARAHLAWLDLGQLHQQSNSTHGAFSHANKFQYMWRMGEQNFAEYITIKKGGK